MQGNNRMFLPIALFVPEPIEFDPADHAYLQAPHIKGTYNV